jgi:DNA gyrase subunit A
MKVKDDDELACVSLAQLGDDLVLACSGGRVLRFPIDDENLPLMGRTAQGPQGMRLGKYERLVGCVTVQSGYDEVILVSAAGFGKCLPVEDLRSTRRGDLGSQAFQFSLKTDKLLALLPAPAHSTLTLFSNTDRIAILPTATVPRLGRTGECPRLVKPNQEETLVRVTQVVPLTHQAQRT